jgi:superoxide dismutase, Cu-Zn family
MKNIKLIVGILFFATMCAKANAQTMSGTMQMPASNGLVSKAVCVVYPTQGNTVTGIITFTKVEGGVKVVADLQGLT